MTKLLRGVLLLGILFAGTAARAEYYVIGGYVPVQPVYTYGGYYGGGVVYVQQPQVYTVYTLQPAVQLNYGASTNYSGVNVNGGPSTNYGGTNLNLGPATNYAGTNYNLGPATYHGGTNYNYSHTTNRGGTNYNYSPTTTNYGGRNYRRR